jgi:hypothetical protein
MLHCQCTKHLIPKLTHSLVRRGEESGWFFNYGPSAIWSVLLRVCKLARGSVLALLAEGARNLRSRMEVLTLLLLPVLHHRLLSIQVFALRPVPTLDLRIRMEVFALPHREVLTLTPEGA